MAQRAVAARDEPRAVLLRSARLAAGQPQDILVRDGQVAAIAPGIAAGGNRCVDLDGRHVVPGLWDHHVHFDQWTQVSRRLDVSAARSAADAATLVADRLRDAPPADGGLLAGYGFRDALWPDQPHRDLLDAVSGDIAVVLVAADLHCSWLNSAALRRCGRAGHPNGVLLEDEAMSILADLAAVPTSWAAHTAAAAAARGVVGIVDLEAPWSLDTWTDRVQVGVSSLRVDCGVWPAKLDEAIARGLRTGDVVAGTAGLIRMGPFKVITDGSLNTRTAYCRDPYPGLNDNRYGLLLVPPSDLEPLMRRAVGSGIDCAIHAIGDHANTLALDAFARTGARGSIEHAQLLDESDIRRFAELGVVASVQPEHAVDDRDVADHHWSGRTGRAFAYRSLHDAGVALTLGSDAPVAPLDPWIGIAAAVHRTRDDRPGWHPEQRLTIAAALAASTRVGRTTLRVGDPADLVVLDADPWTADAALLRAMPVAATMLAGGWSAGYLP